MINNFFCLGILCGCLMFCASSCRNTNKTGELPLTPSEQLVMEWESSLRDDYARFSQHWTVYFLCWTTACFIVGD